MMKAPISYLHRLGLRMVIYLDDILVLNKTREGAVLDGIKVTVRETLESMGFMIIKFQEINIHTCSSN